MAHRVAATEARFEQEIRRSRFIGIARPASSPEEAAAALSEFRTDYPDATHHCWAYLLGDPDNNPQIKMDDAGEPAGTAGRPIANVLQHKRVGDVLLVVVRYFGGIKLGAGGLVRAYSSTASRVMDALETTEARELVDAFVRCGYGDERSVRRVLDEYSVTIGASEYREHVELALRVPAESLEGLRAALLDRTSGRVALSRAKPEPDAL